MYYFTLMVRRLSESNSILCNWLKEIRSLDIQNDRARFRMNMERIGCLMAIEISKQLRYESKQITTPLGEKQIMDLIEQPILATILRAGIPMFQGMLQVFDQADCAFIAAYRKHYPDGHFEIDQQYMTFPDFNNKVLIVADPMLATGASLVTALENILLNNQPLEVHIASILATEDGIDYVQRKFPQCQIWCADIDDALTGRGYIVPGLGDAGDLAFGPKIQQ
jgi:uracil phosphoribosyltransferase